MQSLDVISINLWQTVASLANLALLCWIIKKFLYQPVKKMLNNRQNAIQSAYDAADAAKAKAISDQKEYEEKLRGARAEADSMIRSAVKTASDRENEILAQAKEKAEGIVRQAENDAALELKKAEAVMKREIVEVSSALTEKLLQREVSVKDHQNLIDSFIERIGDEDVAD